MKRRTVSKTSSADSRASRLGSSLRGGISSKTAPCPTKKLAKKRVSKSAAASILGLKKSSSSPEGSATDRWSSDESSTIDHVGECKRLREQLERVLVDHQRQEEEIVALRALAKSLKEEVETIHERQQLQSSGGNSDSSLRGGHRAGSHGFFKLNVQVENLESENAELRCQLESSQEELQLARACMAEKIPVYKLAAVKANAELRCVKSQLHKERTHSDLLQKKLVRCEARQDDVPVRVSPERDSNQEVEDRDSQESGIVRREREAFLRQCMRHRESKTPLSPGNRQETTKQNDLDVSAVEGQAVIETGLTSCSLLMSSMEPDTSKKMDKLIHEDLFGLDFYPNLSPTS